MRLRANALLGLLLMAVAYLTPNTAASFDQSFTASSTLNNTVDGGNANDKLVVAGDTFRQAQGGTIASKSFNSIAMSFFGVAVIDTQCYHRMAYLAIGSGDLSAGVTLGTTTGAAPGAETGCTSFMVFSGVDQATPFDGYGSASGTDTSAELDITSAVGDLAFWMLAVRAAGPTSTAPTGASYDERFDNVNSASMHAGGDAAGAATVQFRSAITVSIGVNAWVALGANLNAAAGGGGGGSSKRLLGGNLINRGITFGRLIA